MGRAFWSVVGFSCLMVAWQLFPDLSPAVAATSSTRTASATTGAETPPIQITAERVDYLRDREVYEADGGVVIVQGGLRLTADHVTLETLTGKLVATGHVRLMEARSDMWAERLELNVNTEGGVVTNGQLYVKPSNSYVTGRLMQRFSEDHYRIKQGTFTNCDAQEGAIPAWRFRFEDLDLVTSESIALKGGWLCVNDYPLIPIPTFTYPLAVRRTGFLIPLVGYDNRFGLHLEETFYWAIDHSQDLMITPTYFSDLGYGSDLTYRYMLNRQSKGQWYLSYLQQTKLPNVSGVDPNSQDVKKARGMLSGSHTHQVNPDLLVRAQAFLVTDPNYLQQLSNSGALRASPSGESNLLTTQRLARGNLYLLGQYLQPLQSGGTDTFQRLPEIGYSLPSVSLLGSPVLLGMDADAVNFYREKGFTVNRGEVVPGLSTNLIELDHMVGLTPQIKVREVYYTRGAQSEDSIHRETFWAAMDVTSKLARRYGMGDGGGLLHTIEPSVIYEYVPGTRQSNIAQIDQVDDLPKKNLLTYMLRNRLLERTSTGGSFNWLDLTLAQSYHVGAVQTAARDFAQGAIPVLGSATQPLQPAAVSVDGRKLSDVWMRAVIGNTAPPYGPTQQAFARSGAGVSLPPGAMLPNINQYLTIDAFFDPYRGTFSQWNTDLRVQEESNWYVEIGQRYTRDGNRVRRGDIWNPVSFNEVFAPTPEIQFVTAGGAFRTPWGWTVGAKGYYDVKNGTSPEYDIVALYQNPCKCWSLGLYYLQFPDRAQYNFMLNMTGIGWTESFGTEVVKAILSPLLIGERGLPWASPGGPYGRPRTVRPTVDQQ